MTTGITSFPPRVLTNLPSLRRRGSGKMSRRLRRLALSMVVSGTMATSTWFGPLTTRIAADDMPTPAVGGGISILIHRYDPEANLKKTLGEGSIAAWGGLGTHDSCPLAPPDLAVVPPDETQRLASGPVNDIQKSETEESVVAQQSAAANPTTGAVRATSPRFNQMLALAVTASTRRAGIAIEPLLEPFQLVGPTRELIPVIQPPAPPISPLPWPRVVADVDSANADQANADQAGPDPENADQNNAKSSAVAVDSSLDRRSETQGQRDDRKQATSSKVAEIDWQSLGQKVQRWSQRGLQTLGEIQRQWKISATAPIAAAAKDASDESVTEAIELLAREEPLDVQSGAPAVVTKAATSDSSLVAETSAETKRPASEAAEPNDMPAGSAPMVATIREAYLPYDLAARDLKWLSTPVSSLRPITGRDYYLLRPAAPGASVESSVSQVASDEVRSSVAESNEELADGLAEELADGLALPEDPAGQTFASVASTADQAGRIKVAASAKDVAQMSAEADDFVDAQPVSRSEPVVEIQASPECLIEEAIWRTRRWLDRYGVDQWSARMTGFQVARWTSRRHQVQRDWVDQVAQTLARRPIPVPVPDPLPNAAPQEAGPQQATPPQIASEPVPSEKVVEVIAEVDVETSEEGAASFDKDDQVQDRLAGELNPNGPHQIEGSEADLSKKAADEAEVLRSWQELTDIVVQVQQFVAERVAAAETLVQDDAETLPAASIATEPNGETSRR